MVHVKDKGQLKGISSLILPVDSREQTQALAWQQMSLPPEPFW